MNPAIKGRWIETLNGGKFNPLEPIDPTALTIEDLARSLSRLPRFAGQTKHFYSVAQHSINVAALLEHEAGPGPVALVGLFHDAAEAFLGDIPTPIKVDPLFEGYRIAENRALRNICNAFSVPWWLPDVGKPVTWADHVLLNVEAKALMPAAGWYAEVEGIDPGFFTLDEEPMHHIAETFAKYYEKLLMATASFLAQQRKAQGVVSQ